MLILCWVLATIYLVFAVLAIFSPESARCWSRWFDTPIRLRVSTIFGIALGAIIYLGRNSTYLHPFVAFYGIFAVVSSLVYLVLPWKFVRKINDASINSSDSWYRFYGVITILFSFAFFIAAHGISR